MSLINESMCGTVKALCTVTGRRIYPLLNEVTRELNIQANHTPA